MNMSTESRSTAPQTSPGPDIRSKDGHNLQTNIKNDVAARNEPSYTHVPLSVPTVKKLDLDKLNFDNLDTNLRAAP